jgi:LPXTG-motif cell wall-anchored protein
MNKTVSIALLVVGIILLVMGFNASESLSSEVSETFTGTPTDKSIWLLVGGALLAIVGGLGFIRRRA